VFTVEPDDPAQRLDMLIVARLARAGRVTSRSTVQLWIDHERVQVDHRPAARAGMRVRPGAVIHLQPEPPAPSEAVADPTVELSILYEDPHLIVIDKPAGLVVHPAKGHATGTLVNGLLARGFFDQAPIDDRDPEGKRRPGIVHRLDKDTSGVMVVARTAQAREGLKTLFAKHDIDREYRAVVVGVPTDCTWDTMIGRHPTDRLRFTTRTGGTGRRAVTHVRALDRLAANTTLVACRLETGRTHQIRVHLSECASTPVLGDALYGAAPKDPWLASIAKRLNRQWLHAAVLGFRHPVTGETMRFESSLPHELAEVLRALSDRSIGGKRTSRK
jgi:23S rRNA pseudouridine1911/1915/1917 synthase